MGFRDGRALAIKTDTSNQLRPRIFFAPLSATGNDDQGQRLARPVHNYVSAFEVNC